jgi:hypothetical protein
MAVYEGARPRPGFLGRTSAPRRPHVVERPRAIDGATPAARPAHATLPLERRPAGESIARRRGRARLRAGRRSGRLGLLLGGIVLAFLLAFFSLAQTVRVTATDYEVNRLLADQAALQAQRQELLSDLNRLGREPAVRKQAIDLGLFPLAEPVVVRSR